MRKSQSAASGVTAKSAKSGSRARTAASSGRRPCQDQP